VESRISVSRKSPDDIKQRQINLAPGEHARFLTVNRAGRFTWFLVGTLGVGPMYVSIARVADSERVDQAL
jgi:hypothetical protein